MKVIFWFMKVIFRFMQVIFWFMQVTFRFMKVIFKKKFSDFSGHYVLHATPKGSAHTSLGPKYDSYT